LSLLLLLFLAVPGQDDDEADKDRNEIGEQLESMHGIVMATLLGLFNDELRVKKYVPEVAENECT
jgi:hypothetical protein